MSLPDIVSTHFIQELIQRALAEDIGPGDVTSESLFRSDDQACAVILSRGDYVLSGGPMAAAVFTHVDPRLHARLLVQDGTAVTNGARVMEVRGPARGLLAGERTALNFIQRMTGVATLTRAYVDRLAGTRTVLLDTRKTTPDMRILDKYAVRCGGGTNHRMGLFDRVMIKDNHKFLWKSLGRGSLRDAVALARKRYPGLQIEVEVETRAEVDDVIKARPDWVLLDNMPLDEMRECVKVCAGVSRIEASGGITLDTVGAVAATGVDAISVGALTHSAKAADFSLEMETEPA